MYIDVGLPALYHIFSTYGGFCLSILDCLFAMGRSAGLEGTLSSYSHCILLLHFLQHTGLLPNLQEKPEQKPKEIPSCTYFLGSSEHGEIYELHTAIFMVNVINLLRILGAPPYVGGKPVPDSSPATKIDD